MNTDPIADLLTRIRNAVKARHLKTMTPYSGLKAAVLEVMKKRKFIQDFKILKNGNISEIEIHFDPAIKTLSLKRISKPGQRIYIQKSGIQPVVHGYGIAILSTPRGVMAGDEAFKTGVGGEYLCQVW